MKKNTKKTEIDFKNLLSNLLNNKSESHCFSTARVKTLVTKCFINNNLQDLINELNENKLKNNNYEDFCKNNLNTNKELYNKYNILTDDVLDKNSTYELLKSKLVKKKIRFSHNCFEVLTTFLEHIMKDIILYSCINCLENNRKIIKPIHYNSNSHINDIVNNLDCYNKLMSYINKKKENKNVEEDHDDSNEDVDDEDVSIKLELDQNKYKKYNHYIFRLFKQQKNNILNNMDNDSKEAYKNICCSKLFKYVCSIIIYELVEKISKMLEVEVLSRSVKTINKNIMVCVLKLLLISSNLPNEYFDRYICPELIRNEKNENENTEEQ